MARALRELCQDALCLHFDAGFEGRLHEPLVIQPILTSDFKLALRFSKQAAGGVPVPLRVSELLESLEARDWMV